MNTGITTRYRSWLVATLTAALGLAAGSAQAYAIDTKLGERLLGNSGDLAERTALADILSVDVNTLTIDEKINTTSAMIFANAGGGWYLDVDPNAPGYFLLKFGIGNTDATADTFFFQNDADLTKLVWTNDQVQFLTGGDCGARNQNACNIGRLSHYTSINDGGDGGGGGDGNSVPEPASVALVGLALLGAAAARKRQLA